MAILMPILLVLSVVLSLCILVQHRASGLTSTFGGSGATFVQRRGAEKVIYRLTIWLSVIYFALALLALYVNA